MKCFGIIITGNGFTGTMYPDLKGVMHPGCKGVIGTGDGCKGIILPGGE